MIAVDSSSSLQLLLRLLAPFVWRNERKVAAKLDGFASTEAGSALDMLKAAELTDDPTLRRLFFRHAMDEAEHRRAEIAKRRLQCAAEIPNLIDRFGQVLDLPNRE